jgi:hypothetical protein
MLGAVTALAAPIPLLRVHAHNDYEHEHPLFDALDHGFCSVEADVHLVNGRLLVAHDRWQVKPERTLESLYLDPLRQRVQQNGGRVYRNGPEVMLLIDFKGDWRAIYPVLRQVLGSYTNLLTCFRDGMTETNAVRVIITGNRSKEMLAGETVRYAALDGSLSDLDSDDPPSLIPWISGNWFATFTWRGTGTMPPAERSRLENIVARAHRHGRRVRFWGAPDQPVFWRTIYDANVDLINTDDLAGAQKFLLSLKAPEIDR